MRTPKLEIRDDSSNYTGVVVKLPAVQTIAGLDNLVRVNVFGNDCLIGKDTDLSMAHLFFPAECALSAEFLHYNNLYRHSELNFDTTKKGFFEDNGRVKTLKFKGVISSGFVTPITSLAYLDVTSLKIGEEFTDIDGRNVCKKYIRKGKNANPQQKQAKLLDSIVDSRLAPEHLPTAHLLRNIEKLDINKYVAITRKLHGTSARYYHTLIKRKLSIVEKLLRWLGVRIETEEYGYVCGSKRSIKSVNFETLPGKGHFYKGDLWTNVGKQHIKDKLNKGEAVYCEIIGKNLDGEVIQHGYSYGLEVPVVYVYRISNISPQGIEVDLPYHQMLERAAQLGLNVCPETFYGTLGEFIQANGQVASADHRDIDAALNYIFYQRLLEQPSVLDPTVTEEGFCIRQEKYPRPEIFKIKSKAFLIHEGHIKDQDITDIEEEQV